MVAIVDYRMGNLHSVQKACAAVGLSSRIVSTAAGIRRAQAVVLPGVGAFGMAMQHLRRQRLVATLQATAASGKPFLGVCLGMQLLFDESEEFGRHRGLGLIPGRVKHFPRTLTVPHMGWNQLNFRKRHPYFRQIPEGAYMYFVHSYYCQPQDPSVVIATTDYGRPVAAAVAQGNLFATQFHPEKSQRLGLQIYRNLAHALEKKG